MNQAQMEESIIQQGKDMIAVEKLAKSNKIRLDEQEEEIKLIHQEHKAITDLALAVQGIAQSLTYMQKSIENVDNKVEDVKDTQAKMTETQTKMKDEIDQVKYAPMQKKANFVDSITGKLLEKAIFIGIGFAIMYFMYYWGK